MSYKAFIIFLLLIFSLDILFAFLSWLLYKYLDLKYFSSFEITTLKEENKYLIEQNKKKNGASDFWSDKK